VKNDKLKKKSYELNEYFREINLKFREVKVIK
jgi:hypothetical protein